jgi:hypothetical protein
MHPRIRLHEALYWTFEAKIFGEDAPLVGYETELIIATWRRNKCFAKRITKSSEKKLESVWDTLKPRWLKSSQKRRLARLPEVKALHEL